MNKKALILFILAIICDIASMNIYRSFPLDIGDKIYFSGQSLTVLFYIWTVIVLSKEMVFLNTIATAYLPFAINDIYENIMGYNTDVTWIEIICGIVSLCIVLYKFKEWFLSKISSFGDKF